jgi:hypothetical protein
MKESSGVAKTYRTGDENMTEDPVRRDGSGLRRELSAFGDYDG